jgi:hypothetical protein
MNPQRSEVLHCGRSSSCSAWTKKLLQRHIVSGRTFYAHRNIKTATESGWSVAGSLLKTAQLYENWLNEVGGTTDSLVAQCVVLFLRPAGRRGEFAINHRAQR